MVELQAKQVRFYSNHDEEAFFEWVKKIPSVSSVEGVGLSIIITVDKNTINAEDLRDLLSIFQRYEIAMKQLVVFDMKKFAPWFRNKEAYWYNNVFGE